MAAPAKSGSDSYVGGNPTIPGMPFAKEYPTPHLDERIYVVRKDTKATGFVMPEVGDVFDGRDASPYKDFLFTTAKPTDQTGWVDLYYVNERANQDEYNYTVDYPYVDKDYPRITRTYVYLREGLQELQADTEDPVYGSNWKLTDHKWIRMQDPALDNLFIGVQRVYEKLPSPQIESHEMNQYQQDVTILKQEMVASALPTLDAETELAKVDRTGTAKVLVTVATVDEVFPANKYTTDRTEHAIPFNMRSRVPGKLVESISAGTASQPVLAQNEWTGDEQQLTEFKMKSSRTTHDLGTAGFVSLVEYKLTNDQQLSTTTTRWQNSGQSLVPSALLIEGKIDELGNGDTMRSQTFIPNVFGGTAYHKDIPDPVPLKFRVAIPTYSTAETLVGTATMPSLGTGDLEASDEQKTDFWHRVTVKTRGTIVTTSLVSYKFTNQQQIETVTETLGTGLQTLAGDVDETTIEANVDNLGNNTSLKLIGSVDNLFGETAYHKEIPDPVPLKFRVAVPVYGTGQNIAGAASMPTLGTGDLEITDEQKTDFWHRVTTRTRGTIVTTSLVSYKMTDRQQIETVTETLGTGLQTLAGDIDEKTIEANVDNLGNNTSLKMVGAVGSLFDNLSSSTEIRDLVPAIFGAVLPVYEVQTTLAGSITNPPPLGTGDLSRKEVQETTQKYRRTVVGRSGLSYPQSATASQQIGGVEFGGEQLQTTALLNSSAPAVESGLGVTQSKVTNLGNGTWVRETEKFDSGVTEWPTLVGTEVDPRTGIAVGIEKKVVAAGTTGGVTGTQYIDVKPIDKWRSIQITSSLDPDTLPETVQWETTAEYAFPNVLLDVEWLWAAASADCCVNFDMALQSDIQQGYAGPCRALITESFTVGPPGDTVGITQWFPQGHSIGYSWAVADGDCGTCAAQAKTWQIPPTLHDEITIAGGVTLDDGSFTSVLPATCPVGLPAPGTLITKSVDVERWRFGVFYRRVTQIYVPDPSC